MVNGDVNFIDEEMSRASGKHSFASVPRECIKKRRLGLNVGNGTSGCYGTDKKGDRRKATLSFSLFPDSLRLKTSVSTSCCIPSLCDRLCSL